MTPEQAKQYEICKTRRHEEQPAAQNYAQNYQNQLAQAAQSYTAWKTCRWCGTQYQDVLEPRQVERSE